MPKTPKQKPPLAVGQVWRPSGGSEATIYNTYLDIKNMFVAEHHDSSWTEVVCEGDNHRLVEYLRETDRPHIKVGKRYRSKSGEVFLILREWDGAFWGHSEQAGSGQWFLPFGFKAWHRHGDAFDLVAEAEDEPAKIEEPAETPKQKPPLAEGQVWRTRSGRTVRIAVHGKAFVAVDGGGCGCWVVDADGAQAWDAGQSLDKYIGEANLDPKAEGVVQSKEIPLQQEATMSSKPQERPEAPQQNDQFNQYLIEECARLRAMLEQKDERLEEIAQDLRETLSESARSGGEMVMKTLRMQSEMATLHMEGLRKIESSDARTLRELCSSNFDAVFEELSDIKDTHSDILGDLAVLGSLISSKMEVCTPPPAPTQPPAEDVLDKGLKLTYRTLTAAQILWKILQFAVAASLFGGAATCAVMMLK